MAEGDSYGRHFVAGVCFVTWRTFGGEPLLSAPAAVHLLRSVLAQVKRLLAYRTVAYVFLPDHVHLMLAPAAGVALDQLMGRVRERYTQEYAQLVGSPQPVWVWQPDHRVRTIHDVEEFALYLDAVHFDPVEHGLAARPEAWPDSSYQVWVERGLYTLGWGWTRPARLAGRRWE
jgi:putative transposase